MRATWDYDHRREEFLAWAEAVPRLLNSAQTFAWNTDKRYLLELGEHVRVVPSAVAYQRSGVAAAAAQFNGAVEAVAKPIVGAGGRGVQTGTSEHLGAADLGGGPWLVQPLIESVRDEGETSVFVFGDVVGEQVRKVPATGEVRVHEQFGGRSALVPQDPDAVALAVDAVAAARVLGHRVEYARVDLMRLPDGQLAVSELEATEPGLYLDLGPGNAGPFADLVTARLKP